MDYDGQIFRLRNFRLAMEAPGRRIPIYVAAMGPRNVRLSAEVADGVMPFFPYLEDLGYFKVEIEAGARQAGKDLAQVDLAPHIVTCVMEDGEEARAYARRHLAFYLGGMGDFYNDLVRRYGFVEEADAVKEAWAPAGPGAGGGAGEPGDGGHPDPRWNALRVPGAVGGVSGRGRQPSHPHLGPRVYQGDSGDGTAGAGALVVLSRGRPRRCPGTLLGSPLCSLMAALL